jgi:DNA/RNA endonuclease YhcR with UshA esterase domain
MRLTHMSTVASAMFLLVAFAASAAEINAEDAANHIGQTVTVCGVVASAKYAANSRSQPTFLDMGRPYPNEPFTAVIFGSDRAKFGEPERTLAGKRVCITGAIRQYRGRPEIIVSDPGQLTQ